MRTHQHPQWQADKSFTLALTPYPRKADKLDGSQIKYFMVAGHSFSKEARSFYVVLTNGQKTEFITTRA
ncbi:hypothetical protein Tco_0389639 [Tanacetum coccineum]